MSRFALRPKKRHKCQRADVAFLRQSSATSAIGSGSTLLAPPPPMGHESHDAIDGGRGRSHKMQEGGGYSICHPARTVRPSVQSQSCPRLTTIVLLREGLATSWPPRTIIFEINEFRPKCFYESIAFVELSVEREVEQVKLHFAEFAIHSKSRRNHRQSRIHPHRRR